jgi:hypothetical protein
MIKWVYFKRKDSNNLEERPKIDMSFFYGEK